VCISVNYKFLINDAGSFLLIASFNHPRSFYSVRGKNTPNYEVIICGSLIHFSQPLSNHPISLFSARGEHMLIL